MEARKIENLKTNNLSVVAEAAPSGHNSGLEKLLIMSAGGLFFLIAMSMFTAIWIFALTKVG